MENTNEYQLCYIDNVDDWSIYKLYFTSKFEGQWGDDWNDRPACCNAGEPYSEDRNIVSIYLEIKGFGQTTFGGKIYSVEDMNKNRAVWLIYEDVIFEGGDTLEKVLNKIEEYNSIVEDYNRINVYKEI
jgi:hypothetical protein